MDWPKAREIDAVGAGADGGVALLLLGRRRRGEVEIGDAGRQDRVGRLGGDADDHVALDRGAGLAGEEADVLAGEVGVERPVDARHDRLGVEGRAVVELDAGTDGEEPVGVVGARPLGGEERNDLAVGGIEAGQRLDDVALEDAGVDVAAVVAGVERRRLGRQREHDGAGLGGGDRRSASEERRRPEEGRENRVPDEGSVHFSSSR